MSVEFAEEAFCAADPDTVALALEGGGVGVVADDFAEFGEGEFAVVAGEVKFGELDFGAGIGMAFGDLLPEPHGGFGLVEGGHGFGEGHE